MEITRVRIIPEDAPDPNWRFTVVYTALFAPAEVGTAQGRFADAARLWVRDHLAREQVAEWTGARLFDPVSTRVTRMFIFSVPRDLLGAAAAEHIRAEVAIRNHSRSGRWLHWNTPALSLSA